MLILNCNIISQKVIIGGVYESKQKNIKFNICYGAILLVGCNNKETNEISVDSTNQNTIIEEADTKDLETSEVTKDEVVKDEVAKGITEDEALKIVYDNIKLSTPDIKLKIKNREFVVSLNNFIKKTSLVIIYAYSFLYLLIFCFNLKYN